MMSMDQPFGMQPQRRPVGVFGQPAEGGNGGSTGPQSEMVRARFGPGFGFGGRPRPVAPIRPAENGSPAATTAPTNSGPFTPRPDVPAASGPYSYSGPTMNLLGMTDAPAPVSPAAPIGGGGAVNRFFGGGGGFDPIGVGGPRRFMY